MRTVIKVQRLVLATVIALSAVEVQYGVFDPENRFRGKITYLQGWPGDGRCFFPVEGGTNIVTRVLGGD